MFPVLYLCMFTNPVRIFVDFSHCLACSVHTVTHSVFLILLQKAVRCFGSFIFIFVHYFPFLVKLPKVILLHTLIRTYIKFEKFILKWLYNPEHSCLFQFWPYKSDDTKFGPCNLSGWVSGGNCLSNLDICAQTLTLESPGSMST